MNANGKTVRAARLGDIIGPQSCEADVPARWKRHYQRLIQLRQELLQDVGGLEEEARAESVPCGVPMGDAATDNFDHDLALSLLASEQDALHEIDAALQRIREERYGYCELTGEAIPAARLNAIPWARHTWKAQAELESKGKARHAHLNPLAPLSNEAPLPSE